MTQYRLNADEWWQEVDRTPTCSECGALRGDRDVKRTRHRRGAIVDVTGSDEARLLAAGALAPLDAEAPDENVETESPVQDAASAATSAVEAARSSESASAERAASGPAPKRPPQVAPKADWVEYVVTAGLVASTEEADEMSKVELIGLAQ